MELDVIKANLHNVLTETDFKNLGEKKVGKVRDSYFAKDHVILITTDRQSAFDRVLAAVPFKGQVLNQTSAWWFEKTKNIVPNHVIAVPDPNVTVGRLCEILPVEMVVRTALTGTTSTSIWVNYQKGEREFGGLKLPDDLKKNSMLERPILTPTTKFEEHDRNLTGEEIVAEGLLSKVDWEKVSKMALDLFAFGQKESLKRGLLLESTKYEFGKTPDGQIIIADEIHTPDSSRYWLAESYEQRIAEGKEPENIDKEFLRLWFKEHCDPYKDEVLPEAPPDLVAELSRRYIMLYEMITGEKFQANPGEDIAKRIENNLKQYRV